VRIRDGESGAAEVLVGATVRRAKRAKRHDEASREAALAVLRESGSLAAASKKLGELGMPVSRKTLQRWYDDEVAPRVCKRAGRPVPVSFEKAVLSRLVFLAYSQTAASDTVATPLANVLYSYAIVREAAEATRRAPLAEWASGTAEGELVAKMKFSNKWVQGVLRRHGYRRRRVTATLKADRPDEAAVRARMAELQKVISGSVEGEEPYGAGDTINADETGVFYSMPPRNQYVHATQSRAAAPAQDDKGRFTAMLAATAAGVMLPAFIIIKCFSDKADLSATTTLSKQLKHQPGFKDAGWEELMWEHTAENGTVFKRPYWFNTITFAVITIQHRAWMDTTGIIMWSQLVLKPWTERRHRRALLVWDNCSSHRTPAAVAAIKAANVRPETLPPNMTDLLQVMDVAINAPLKAALRRARVTALADEFRTWSALCSARLARDAKAPMLPFAPPPSRVDEGIRNVLDAVTTVFAEEDFSNGIRRTFFNVGLAPDSGGRFRRYCTTPEVLLSAPMKPDLTFSMADLVATIDVVGREVDQDKDWLPDADGSDTSTDSDISDSEEGL